MDIKQLKRFRRDILKFFRLRNGERHQIFLNIYFYFATECTIRFFDGKSPPLIKIPPHSVCTLGLFSK